MMNRRLVSAAITVAVIAGAWALLAPTALGGALTYVTVRGGSMRPALQDGDLAIVRARDRYAVGDVVAYRSDALGTVVLHRIVEQRDARFVLRGDANDSEDRASPRAEDMVGVLWLRVPGAGTLLGAMRTPAGLGVLAFIGLMGWGRRAGRAPPRLPRGTAIAASAAIALPLTMLAVTAFLLPVSRAHDERLALRHTATFAYAGDVEPSTAYPAGRIEAGDPVYLQLVSALEVQAAYALALDGASDITGEATMVALLEDGTGWQRRFPLAAATTFSGPSAMLAGTIDLARIRGVARAMGELTGVRPATHRVSFVAEVAVTGRIDAQRFGDRVTLSAPFRLEPLLLIADGDQQVARENAVTVRRAQANAIGLGAVRIDVASARVVAPLLALLALLVLGWIWRGRRDEEAPLPRRHVATLIEVEPLANERAVEVASLEALVRLADHTGAIVLAERSSHPSFVLRHEGTTYRFAAARNGSRNGHG